MATSGGTAGDAASAVGYTGTAGTQSRWVNIGLWVLQVVAAAGFLMASFTKFTALPEALAVFQEIGFGRVGMYAIGLLELAGAIALLVPRLVGLAGLAFIALMIGAVATQLFVVGSGVANPAVMLVIVAIIAWGRRDRTAELARVVRGRRR
jgi:putative oxidoreductase